MEELCPYCGEMVDVGVEYHPCSPRIGAIRRRLAQGPVDLFDLAEEVDAPMPEVRAVVAEMIVRGEVEAVILYQFAGGDLIR